MVSARIYNYVKDYAEKHNLSISQLIMKGFDSYREHDLEHAMERLRYHEERVIHWKQNVIQSETECNTKQQFCNTIKEAFLEQGRGSRETRTMDKNWLEPKVEQLQSKGIPITLEELYNFCIKKEEEIHVEF